ncbi:MAG TPA: 16S rRNA (adenine(1518)-N(6)/adenine(1519)-N(6))-dimethyltransferase RsmA [Bacilli bacterium]|jgi:16S rRNA (adenine1518-N6/adenine1519-N6)-dimethyltransferase|nr:16S rRNA (adenine(1518)-N(6)/adenine(1519)-N(6))-dimethyltransferase RsmA [Bacilli bacterium]
MDKFKHKKSLGQNFLKDDNVLNKIVNTISLQPEDLVIEIGPGQGALTKKLVQKNVNLVCYEVDERTKPYLGKLCNSKTKIIFNDFMKADIKEDIGNIKYNNLYIIANLPYYITTPIIKKIILDKLPVKSMILMMQKEVAERFSSNINSKEYGSITLYLNYYFKINKLFDVSRNSFDPIPNVDSSVVEFDVKTNKVLVENEELFFNIINDAFRQKRKNLKNNLKNYDLEKIATVLKNYGLNLQNRAENLSINVFADIANSLNE